MDPQGRCRVAESAVVHIHVQAEMVEEVSTQNRLLDIRHNENPPKGPAKAQVQREGSNAECRNRGPIDSLQREGTLVM